MPKGIIRKVNISRLQLAVILLLITGIGSFLYFNSSASSPTQKPPYPLGCETGSTNVNTAAALRTAVSNGQNACVTAGVGNVDLSGINRANPVYVGTSSGSIGAISIVGSRSIVIRQARVRSVDIRDSQFITVEKSTLGGTSSGRVLDNIITSLGYSPGIDTSDDVTIQDNDIGWTTADTSGNTGYGIRVYGGDRFKVQRNYIHHIGADGIQMGSDGKDNVIDRNEFAYIAPPPSSDEHSDDIQITGHGPNLRITNNYLHHNGWLDAGGASSGGSGPYIHGGSTGSLLFENNLVRDERNYMQVADLGTGGTSISNLTFRRNTFFNNGTMWPNPPDLSWQINSGTNNLLERNVVNDNFGNKYGFGTHTSANNNLNGAAYTIDNQGECTVTVCNPASQEPIGYRCPTDVWWCSNSTTPPPPIGTSVANIWVDTNGGSCTYHATSSEWVDSEGCASFEQAVNKVTNGDTVRVKAGNYDAQTITSDKTATTYVIAEDGTSIGSFKPDSNWVEYQNFAAGNLNMENITPTNVTLRNVDVAGHVAIDGPDYLTWLGGTLGAYQIDLGDWPGRIQIQGIPNATTNLVLDGLAVKPVTRTASCIANSTTCHTEVVRFNEGVTSAVLRNMTFENGTNINSATIFTGNASTTSGSVANLTLENNFFGSNGGQPIVDENPSGACGSWMFRNNTMATTGAAFVENDCSSAANVTISGNIGQVPICRSGVTYSKNVWFGGTCGTSDLNAGGTLNSLGLGGADGFHLTSTSPAINRGDGANFPPTDHDGGSRPFGSAPDAGAHEYGASTPPPTGCSPAQNLGNINCDSKIDIFDLSIILSNYGKTTSQTSNASADLNNSGSVDGTDLSILLSNYGT